jgi:hypothetical protein
VTAFDLRSLVAALSRRDVDYVVVGGVAVGAHGYIRATRDLDIVPDPAPDNLSRLAAALRDLGATLPLASGRPFSVASDLRHLERRENMTLDTQIGGLDIIQRAPGVPSFPALTGNATEADVLGVAVRICSLRHLRQMKLAAGRAQDAADLENLPDA